jgi:hypothetical protein
LDLIFSREDFGKLGPRPSDLGREADTLTAPDYTRPPKISDLV